LIPINSSNIYFNSLLPERCLRMIKVYYQGHQLHPEDYHFDQNDHIVLHFKPHSNYDPVAICTFDEKDPHKVINKKIVNAGIV